MERTLSVDVNYATGIDTATNATGVLDILKARQRAAPSRSRGEAPMP